MAAQKSKPNAAPITAAQRKQVLDLYVYGLAEAPEIAEAIGLSQGSVRALVRPLLAVRQRFWGTEEMQAKSSAHGEEMAGYRATVEVDCAKLGTIRIKGQIVSASNLLSQAVQAKSPEEVRAVARALGPAFQDVTSGRLAVGLSTEKTEIATAVDAYAASLASWLDIVAPETKDDDPGRVVAPATPCVAGADPAGPVSPHR